MTAQERQAATHRALAWISGPRPTKRGCAECGKAERPWRRMMWFPFRGTSGGAFICSDRCWESYAAR
jgi:hypothetical protein